MMFNKSGIKRTILAIHKLGLRFGVQILPAHYYSPVPNILELERRLDEWAKRSEMPGILMEPEHQAANLRRICSPRREEYRGNNTYREAVSKHFGPGYGYIEAQCLHAVIRHFQPRRIIEVGSGVSTYCMLAAIALNEKETDSPSLIVAIEPNPSAPLRRLSRIQLMTQRVQTVPLEVFAQLERGDFLFIDSSHTVKPGGDVNFLILEVLPRLNPGVIVHFHDICLPYDYPRDTLQTFVHGMETSLLHAFLINNSKARVLFCLSDLHYNRAEVLQEVFPEYVHQEDDRGLHLKEYRPFDAIPEHFPSSIYIEII